jgi:hypothetical protein
MSKSKSRSRSRSNNPYSFKYTDTLLGDHYTRTIHLQYNNNKSRKKEEIGHFSIDEKIVNHERTRNPKCFNSGNTCSMTISIDDEHQRKGLTREMIKEMVQNIRKEYPQISDDQYLFIDADASDGFWDKIGMEENPNYDADSTVEGSGYEKRITFGNLEKFANNSPSRKRKESRSKGGSRKTKRKKSKRNN